MYKSFSRNFQFGLLFRKIQLWDLRKNYSSLKTNPIPKQTIPYAGKNVRNHGNYNSLVKI